MSLATGSGPSHLIERAAERLQGTGGLIPPPPVERTRLREPDPVGTDQADAGQVGAGQVGAGQMDAGQGGRLPGPAPNLATDAEAAPGGAGTAVLEAPAVRRSPGPEARAEARPETGPGTPTIDFPALEKAGLVVGRKTRTRISEEFRITVGGILRTIQTAYSSGSATANLLMITSARPGEGKSFSALNIAGSIAQHGQREVLLVDVDAKQRPITHQLGLGECRGLLDLAANPGLRIEDVLVRTAIPNLAIMPIGSRTPDAVAGTVARPISAVVERLGRRFANRVIILDAPPCLSTSDPSALAPLVGQIIMVVEAERTQRNEVEAAFDLVKSCPTVTLLLNKIQLTTSYTFGAYHYFGSYS